MAAVVLSVGCGAAAVSDGHTASSCVSCIRAPPSCSQPYSSQTQTQTKTQSQSHTIGNLLQRIQTPAQSCSPTWPKMNKMFTNSWRIVPCTARLDLLHESKTLRPGPAQLSPQIEWSQDWFRTPLLIILFKNNSYCFTNLYDYKILHCCIFVILEDPSLYIRRKLHIVEWNFI